MSTTRTRAIHTLERRLRHVEARIATKAHSERALPYDRAEAAALRWVLAWVAAQGKLDV